MTTICAQPGKILISARNSAFPKLADNVALRLLCAPDTHLAKVLRAPARRLRIVGRLPSTDANAGGV